MGLGARGRQDFSGALQFPRHVQLRPGLCIRDVFLRQPILLHREVTPELRVRNAPRGGMQKLGKIDLFPEVAYVT